MSNVDKLKYNGVEYDLGKSIDASLTQSGQPADAKEVGDKLNLKVDKIDGKGLSSNDYTTDEKTKLAGIENGANKTLIDTTLVNTGQAADAKTVGDAIANEDKKALAAFATDTASGAIANFSDGADSIPMKDVLVHIEPVQAGSGDPSPDNVRPITGWTGCVISHSGADMTNPTTYSITFPTEAGTVYGGTLDVTSGVLTVTHKLYTFDGSENWTAGNHDKRYEFNLGGLPDYIRTWNSDGRGLSNLGIYDDTAYRNNVNYITSRVAVGASDVGSKTHVLVVPAFVATTVEELKAFLANTPEQWYAPLQTPQTYQLTQQEITSLLGTNNLWADTGDSEVEYRADTKVYVDAKVAAAESNITTLQNSKVDKTTPLLNFDDTATDPLTDDGALANALSALAILDDVIPSGGGALYLKKALTKLTEQVKQLSMSKAPTSATYANGFLEYIKSNWTSYTSGAVSTAQVQSGGPNGGAMIYKYNASYGCALVISYHGSIPAPLLIRNLNNTWSVIELR